MTPQPTAHTAAFSLAVAAAIAFVSTGCSSDSPEAVPASRTVYVRDIVGQTLSTAQARLGNNQPGYTLAEDTLVVSPPESTPVDPLPPLQHTDDFLVVAACFFEPKPTPTASVATSTPAPLTPPSVSPSPPGPPQFPTSFPAPAPQVYWDNAVLLAVVPTAGVTPAVSSTANRLGYQQIVTNQPRGKDCRSLDDPINVPSSTAAR